MLREEMGHHFLIFFLSFCNFFDFLSNWPFFLFFADKFTLFVQFHWIQNSFRSNHTIKLENWSKILVSEKVNKHKEIYELLKIITAFFVLKFPSEATHLLQQFQYLREMVIKKLHLKWNEKIFIIENIFKWDKKDQWIHFKIQFFFKRTDSKL